MCYSRLAMLIPCALLLSAYTTVTPAHKDNDPRIGPCVQGGSNSVAQQSHDCRTQHHGSDITTLRLYLSDKLATLLDGASHGNSHRELLGNDPFSSRTILPDSVHVASASTILNRDARSTPLRVDLKQGDRGWRDEVLMIQEGQCWVIDGVRRLGDGVHVTASILCQPTENR